MDEKTRKRIEVDRQITQRINITSLPHLPRRVGSTHPPLCTTSAEYNVPDDTLRKRRQRVSWLEYDAAANSRPQRVCDFAIYR